MSDCDRSETLRIEREVQPLAESDRAWLEAHLASCAACRESDAADRDLLAAYRELPDEDVPEDVAARVLADAREAAAGPRRRLRLLPALVAVAVAVLLLVLGTLAIDRAAPARTVAEELSTGDELRRRGRFDEAFRAYDRAVALAESTLEEAAALHLSALVLEDMAEFRLAVRRVDRVLTSHPDYEKRRDLYVLRSDLLASLGEFGAAFETLKVAMGEFPEDRDRLQAHAESLREDRARQRLSNIGYTESLDGLGYIGD